MKLDSDIWPVPSVSAPRLLKGADGTLDDEFHAATFKHGCWLDELERRLENQAFSNGPAPTAADSWLLLAIAWVQRAIDRFDVATSDNSTRVLAPYRQQLGPSLARWVKSFSAIEGVVGEAPPYWDNFPLFNH